MSEPKYHMPPRVALIDGDVRVDLSWLIRGMIEDLARSHTGELGDLLDLLYDADVDPAATSRDEWHRARIDLFIDQIAKAVGTDMVLTPHAAGKLVEAIATVTPRAVTA